MAPSKSYPSPVPTPEHPAEVILLEYQHAPLRYQVVLTAAKLGFQDLLAGPPLTAEQIAERTGTHLPTLRRFLRCMAVLGVVCPTEDDRWTKGVLTDHLHLMLTPYTGDLAYAATGHALHTLKTGEAAWPAAFGSSFYAYLDDRPIEAQQWNDWNTFTANTWLPPLAAGMDLSKARRVVDVCGGQGTLLAMFLARNPHLQGTVFDLPEVVKGAPALLEAAGVRDRAEVVGGSVFDRDTIPTDGDVYTICRALVNWNDEKCFEILTNIHAAMPRHAMLFVMDVIVPSDPSDPNFTTQVFSDLHNLVIEDGGHRYAEEWKEIVERAAFTVRRVIQPPMTPFVVLAATPSP